MPELPEVQIIVDQLKRHLIGCRIGQISTGSNAKIEGNINSLKNQVVEDICRKGKVIAFKLSDANTLLFQLALTGKLSIFPVDYLLQKHDHISINMGQNLLVFNDARRIGRCVVTKSKLEDLFVHWGVDALDDAFSTEYAYSIMSKRKKCVKNLLMDNSFVMGIGNIYACEILWKSKVHPARYCNALSKDEVGLIVAESKIILRNAIEKGGTTFRDYRQVDGSKGLYQNSLIVYRKDTCIACKGSIKKIPLAGRSSYFCPSCQDIN